MLALVPKRWYSWDFLVLDAVRLPVAEIALSGWLERGSVRAASREYVVARERLGGPFMMAVPGECIASAVKPSFWRSSLVITHRGCEYALERPSIWRREHCLLQAGQRLGSIAPESWIGRRGVIDLPDDLDLALRLFAAWLTLLAWKRAADSA